MRHVPEVVGNGQEWIRTIEGVKPADLQSAPFGHFGTCPSNKGVQENAEWPRWQDKLDGREG